ncbi:MAG: B12-binding domain-containing radical SAM protein [Candidatus Riflebacteria bacterium]|nr:B12-binding domain-containing radical SAM protein [Candidatus Riflebacteria bacterium]
MPPSPAAGTDERLRIVLATFMPDGQVTHSLAMRALKSYLVHRGPASSVEISLKSYALGPTARDTAVSQIVAVDPHIVGFSTYLWNGGQVKEVARRIRERARTPPLVVAGGPEVDHAPESYLREGHLDVVALGEGEEILRRLVETRLQGERRFDDIPNLVYRDGSSIVQTRRDHAFVEDLASHDFPLILDADPHWCFAYETSRGCYFRCRYCKFDPAGARVIRYYPMDKVKGDLEQIFALPALKMVVFNDSNFFRPTDRRRGLDIMELVHELNARRTSSGLEPLIVATMQNPMFLDAETCATLKRLPLHGGTVQCGLQTIDLEVSRKVLDRCFNRHSTLRKLEELSAILGDRLSVDVMYGLPGETLEGYRRSLEFVLSLRSSHLGMCHFHVLPGSYFADHSDDYGLEYQSEPPHRLISSSTWTPDDLARAARLSYAVYLFYCEYFFPCFGSVKTVIRSEIRGDLVPMFDRIVAYLERCHPELFGRWVQSFGASQLDGLKEAMRFVQKTTNAPLVDEMLREVTALVEEYAAEQRQAQAAEQARQPVS